MIIVYTNRRTILKNDHQNKYITKNIIHKEKLLAKFEIFKAIHTNEAIIKQNLENDQFFYYKNIPITTGISWIF